MSTISLQLGNQSVYIDSGELVSFRVDGYQVIHQKGAPGWRSADTEMFPLIGPTAEADFKVSTPRGKAIQDQHGLLREMAYTCIEQSRTKAVFEKRYIANSVVRNSKFPIKSTEDFLSWPYDFRFRKTVELDADGLAVSFGVSAEKGMPFMLGYHPAFELKTAQPTIVASDGRSVALADVLAVGNRALLVETCNLITLNDEKSIKLTSEGFNHFMCWTEVSNMVCIEPITFYPYAVSQDKLHEGFDEISGNEQVFSLRIELVN